VLGRVVGLRDGRRRHNLLRPGGLGQETSCVPGGGWHHEPSQDLNECIGLISPVDIEKQLPNTPLRAMSLPAIRMWSLHVGKPAFLSRLAVTMRLPSTENAAVMTSPYGRSIVSSCPFWELSLDRTSSVRREDAPSIGRGRHGFDFCLMGQDLARFRRTDGGVQGQLRFLRCAPAL